jgi:hypothetical protein
MPFGNENERAVNLTSPADAEKELKKDVLSCLI